MLVANSCGKRTVGNNYFGLKIENVKHKITYVGFIKLGYFS